MDRVGFLNGLSHSTMVSVFAAVFLHTHSIHQVHFMGKLNKIEDMSTMFMFTNNNYFDSA